MRNSPIQVHTTVNGQDVTAGTLFTQANHATFTGMRPADASRWASTLASALAQAVPYVRMHHMDNYSVEIMATRFSHAHDAISQ